MAFTLSRGGRNVPAEVQRWQYFLRKQGVSQVGSIDADFGLNTETATKIFQVTHGLTATGKVNEATLAKAEEFGYKVLSGDYYTQQASTSSPPKPAELDSPSNSTRNKNFTCFKFIQLPRNQRPDNEAIVQKGSCDGSQRDWVATNIVSIDVPQLQFARGSNGRMRCHSKAAPLINRLFQQWQADDLLHLILSYEGSFVPRYKRNQAPSNTLGHSEKLSSNVSELSNHSFGSAFDINYTDNQLGNLPAICGQRGSVPELVAAANAIGIYLGGTFPYGGRHEFRG